MTIAPMPLAAASASSPTCGSENVPRTWSGLLSEAMLRSFGFGRIADGLVARVPAPLREALTAYAEGVNANIAARGEAGLPSELNRYAGL